MGLDRSLGWTNVPHACSGHAVLLGSRCLDFTAHAGKICDTTCDRSGNGLLEGLCVSVAAGSLVLLVGLIVKRWKIWGASGPPRRADSRNYSAGANEVRVRRQPDEGPPNTPRHEHRETPSGRTACSHVARYQGKR
jgi:hypothetical protein